MAEDIRLLNIASINKSHSLETNDSTIKLPVSNNHTTLSKIKKDFEEQDVFSCVTEYHLIAPTMLIQFVVEGNKEQLEKVKQHYTHHREFLTHTYHLNYKWIDEASADAVKGWLIY